MDTARFEALLAELKLPFQREAPQEDLLEYVLTVDEGEGLEVIAFLRPTEDGEHARVMLYLDELDPDGQLDQLRLLMTLNVELPIGAYCLDPDEGIIYATAAAFVSDLDGEKLSWMIEALFVAHELYMDEIDPEGADVVAEG